MPSEQPQEMGISVVMPVFNERSFIEEILLRIQKTGLVKEIVIVDDCSTDGTREWLQKLSELQASGAFVFEGQYAKVPLLLGNLKFYFQAKNCGKGAALRRGFAEVSGDVVIVQDADLEYDPRDYPKLLEPFLDGRADVVYGSRFMGGPQRVHFFWHFVGNKLLTLFSNMLSNLNLSDMETGFKVFRTEVLRSIRITSDRFGFEPEITAKVAKGKWRVYEVPISYSGRSYAEGKKITWRDGLSALWWILKFRIMD